ncbi:beta-ketoacyl synthase N-terminal-like domain-containing protein [Lentzea sp. NPDC005914]|uniref:beta-ketoacyl synthase N-terminal-like domain-containing protein n=1 Tax=Lentzea sp. NPDC005914 TaxID=3154572 RepID=UPI0033C210D4
MDDIAIIGTALRLDDIEYFDADFFGYTDEEAAQLDPQHRLFLECAYHAMERAGYVDWDGVAGLYGTTNLSRYLLDHVYPRHSSTDALLGNMPDGFAARVAYELDLRGPVVTVQSACASGLVAVHLACQDLLSHQCDLALAGAASVDPSAGGNGVGVVVLKRLDEAVNDGDHVHAVIKGSAVANDGRGRTGPHAIGTAGARTAAITALAIAGVDPSEADAASEHGFEQASGLIGLITTAEGQGPRPTSVTASGSGGAHACVVLGQAPKPVETPRTGWHLLQVSARSTEALTELTEQLKTTGHALADVAHTLRNGRRNFRTRTFAVVQDGDPVEFATPAETVDNAAIVLKFSGTNTERDIATARGLLATGISPALLLGMGMGEYAAAAIAGALTAEEAIAMATQRQCPESYEKQIANSAPRAPRIPLLSGATGTLLSEVDITDCGHWLAIADDLCPAAPDLPANAVTVDISAASGERAVLRALGTLWAHGVELPKFRPARRVPLPGYPFRRRRHWLDPVR